MIKENEFHDIFVTYYHRLLGFACSYVEERVACDIVQDVFLNLWKAKEITYASLKSFLYVSVRNRCMNHIRNTSSKSYVDIEDIDLSDEVNVLEEEVFYELYSAINKLPDNYRAVFNLVLDGKTNVEICEILDVSIDSVKSIRKRGYKMLKSDLSKSAFTLLMFFSNEKF